MKVLKSILIHAALFSAVLASTADITTAQNNFSPPPSNWGSPWNPNWNVDNGKATVVACGYDATGIWRIIPLNVIYNYNGVQYDVKVINAWDPWTRQWNADVDVTAVNTSYYLRGQNFDFYVVLSTGTYYFNL